MFSLAGVAVRGQVTLPQEPLVLVDMVRKDGVQVERSAVRTRTIMYARVPEGGMTHTLMYEIPPAQVVQNVPQITCDLYGKHWVKSLTVKNGAQTVMHEEYPEADFMPEEGMFLWRLQSVRNTIEVRVGDYAILEFHCRPRLATGNAADNHIAQVIFERRDSKPSSSSSSSSESSENDWSSSSYHWEDTVSSEDHWSSATHDGDASSPATTSLSRLSSSRSSAFSSPRFSSATPPISSALSSSRSSLAPVPTSRASQPPSLPPQTPLITPPGQPSGPEPQPPTPKPAVLSDDEEEDQHENEDKNKDKDQHENQNKDQERGNEPSGPGCFAQDGTWITDRFACAEEQRQLIQRIRAERQQEEKNGIIRMQAPESVEQAIREVPTRELSPEEELLVKKHMQEKFLERQKQEERRNALIVTLQEAAKRVENLSRAAADDSVKRYLQEASAWYDSAAAFASQEGVTSDELSELVETSKSVGTDVQQIAIRVHTAPPSPPTNLLSRLRRVLELFPQALDLAASRGAQVDGSARSLLSEAIAMFNDIAPRCEQDPKACKELTKALSPLESASAFLKDAVNRSGDPTLKDDIEGMLR